MNEKGSLVEFKNDLVDIHLAQGIYSLKQLLDADHPIQKNQFSISSIIHFYCSIESMINLLGDELLNDRDSNIFIESNNNIALKKLRNSWNGNLSIGDKITFLTENLFFDGLNSSLINEIIELSKLRNLLVHGKVYKSIYLEEHHDDSSFSVLDSEYELDAKKLFPKTKFNVPIGLSKNDSLLALSICIKTLIILSKVQSKKIGYWLNYAVPGSYGWIDQTKTYNEIEADILNKIGFK